MEVYDIKVENEWMPLTKAVYFRLFSTKKAQLVRQGEIRRAKIFWNDEGAVSFCVDNSPLYDLRLRDLELWTINHFKSYLFGMINAWELDDPFYTEESQ